LRAPRAFIIHLERAAGRRATVDTLREGLPIESEILPAVDGQLLSPEAVSAAYVRASHPPRYPFGLAPTEIGAFLSHRAAWRRILAEGLDFGVVLEDDAAIDRALFRSLLDFAMAERSHWEYMLMPAAGSRPAGEVLAERGVFSLTLPRSPPLRAIGQLVSAAAAERLLAVTAPFDRPVDTFLQMAWISGVALMVAAPSPIRDVSPDTGGTTVQRRRMGLADRLRHEVMRPVYRSQVLALYRRYLRGHSSAGQADPIGRRRFIPKDTKGE
jgi:glycosyl transferase, family 25